MAEKKTVPPIVYNSLKPAKNDSHTLDLSGEQIKGSDPRLTKFWLEAAKIAAEQNYCRYYDTIAEKLGGPSRSALGVGSKGSEYYLPSKSKAGEIRKRQTVEFHGSAKVMGRTLNLVWRTRIMTSGTREDINDVLTYLHGMPASEVIEKKLAAERDKAVKRLLADDSAAAPALA